MPNPITNFIDSNGVDLGNKLITKEYLMTVYPQIADQLITPELWVWGYNHRGQLGNNTAVDRCTPVTTFSGGSNWKQVGFNYFNMAAIKTDGTLWIWGSSKESGGSFNTPQMGNNTLDGIDRSTPITTFAGGTNWKQVAVGGMHIAAIKTDGTLWAWGYNATGNVGNNLPFDPYTPVTTFSGGTDWKQVSCGKFSTAAIKTDGTLWAWGFNNYGQVGDNTTIARSIPVTTFAGGNNWKQVSCGESHTAAIKTDGTLWTWGSNSSVQLGNNAATNRTTPVTTFAGGTNWKQVACGGVHTAAIKTDGTLWTWGYNSYGQVADNTTTNRCTPVTTFAGGTDWKQVSGGTYNIAAIKTDGTLWVWGSNSFAGIGINRNLPANILTPVTTFAGGTDWKQVSSGTYATAAIKTSDDLQGI